MTTLVHLVRHAEVHNPSKTWYGRLEGFELSERGHRQAQALADHFENRDIAAVYSSPLIRAIQTARPIAESHGLEVVVEEEIIESETLLEGKPGDRRLFYNPLNIRYFLNPFRPSWGESYQSIATRMLNAIKRMREAHPNQEVVAISHMTPIVVARHRATGDRRPAWMATPRVVGRASVTTLEFDGHKLDNVGLEEVGRSVP